MFSKMSITKSTGIYSDEVKRLKNVLNAADAVVIGADAGLSTSAGFTYSVERFRRYARYMELVARLRKIQRELPALLYVFSRPYS